MRMHYFLILFSCTCYGKLSAQHLPDSSLSLHVLPDDASTIDLAPSELSPQEETAPSSLLSAGRNYALNVYGLNFYQVRFRQRGYEFQTGNSYINGIPINSLENNAVQYGLFTGLNNAVTVQETSEQLSANNFSFGGLGNHFLLDAFAGKRSQYGRVGYAYANRNYRHRLQMQFYSGYNQRGWAYAVVFNARYSQEGYVPGTYTEGVGSLFSIDKRWSATTVNMTFLFSDYENGRQSASVKEVLDLAGTNFYNPAWGLQYGKKRNTNVLKSKLPTVLFSHKSHLGENTFIQSGVGMTLGKTVRTGLDWFLAPDPRPDYYRYLPSYYEGTDASQAQRAEQVLRADPTQLQVQWENMYRVNRSQTDGRSLYILSGQNTDYFQINAGSSVHASVSKTFSVAGGWQFQAHDMHYYQSVEDLLGGMYWLNVNSFVHTSGSDDLSILQYDLDSPDREVPRGQKFGYDYKMKIRQMNEWVQLGLTLRKWDLFLGGELLYRQLERVGYVRNGLYPESSLGTDRSPAFSGMNGKSGVTYKINGRHYLLASVGWLRQPPTVNMVYISARTRNLKYAQAAMPAARSAELSYVWNAPAIKIRSTFYHTQITKAAESRFFYDDVHQNFATYYLYGIEKKHYGWESSIDWNFSDGWTYSCTSAFTNSYFSNRPTLMVTSEVAKGIVLEEPVYLKYFKVPNTPQSIVHSAFQYRSSNNWFLSLSANAFFDRWAAVNPLRRTHFITQDIDPVNQQALLKEITQQEKLPNGWTLDVFGGYSLPIAYNRKSRKRLYLDLLFSGNNLLGRKNIVSYAFEQMRMDLKSYDVEKFPNKYLYAMGSNYYVSMAVRF